MTEQERTLTDADIEAIANAVRKGVSNTLVRTKPQDQISTGCLHSIGYLIAAVLLWIILAAGGFAALAGAFAGGMN